ncbi:MAG: transposase [Proteobacteria bacterium]|nr:transposase [Pseudomonadota bacterium]
MACNLENILRTLATPEEIGRWSLTSLRKRLIKTGARLVRHGRYAIFQMAEVAILRRVFSTILTMINALRGQPRSGAFA